MDAIFIATIITGTASLILCWLSFSFKRWANAKLKHAKQLNQFADRKLEEARQVFDRADEATRLYGDVDTESIREVLTDPTDESLKIAAATCEDMRLQYGVDKGARASTALYWIGVLSNQYGADALAIAIQTLDQFAVNCAAADIEPKHKDES